MGDFIKGKPYVGYAAAFATRSGSFVVMAPDLDALDDVVREFNLRGFGLPVDRTRSQRVKLSGYRDVAGHDGELREDAT